jgi:hypothetical protein
MKTNGAEIESAVGARPERLVGFLERFHATEGTATVRPAIRTEGKRWSAVSVPSRLGISHVHAVEAVTERLRGVRRTALEARPGRDAKELARIAHQVAATRV